MAVGAVGAELTTVIVIGKVVTGEPLHDKLLVKVIVQVTTLPFVNVEVVQVSEVVVTLCVTCITPPSFHSYLATAPGVQAKLAVKVIDVPEQILNAPAVAVGLEVRLIVAPSVKNHSAYKPEIWPYAFNLKDAPKASPSLGTNQEEETLPLLSAIAENGWWY